MIDPRAKESKVQTQQPPLQEIRASQYQLEVLEKARKDEKPKNYHYSEDQKQQVGSSTVTEIQTIEVEPS